MGGDPNYVTIPGSPSSPQYAVSTNLGQFFGAVLVVLQSFGTFPNNLPWSLTKCPEISPPQKKSLNKLVAL